MSAHLSASRKFLKLIFVFVALTAICFTVFVAVAEHLIAKPLDFQAPDASPIDASIMFTIELISADATSRTLVMDWYPIADHCRSNSSVVAYIYLIPALLDSSSPSFSTLPPFLPAYQYNYSEICGGLTAYNPVFRTVAKLLSSEGEPSIDSPSSTLLKYPFDVYFSQFIVYGVDINTGNYIPLNVTRSFGVAVNFEVTFERSFATNDENTHPVLYFYLRVARSRATKTYVVLVAVTNWLITGAFLMICAAAVIYKEHRHYSEIFVVPVGALFAFTSIRANLPGAPAGFGATIDLYSILPVLIVMAICSVFLLLFVLHRRLHEEHIHQLNSVNSQNSSLHNSNGQNLKAATTPADSGHCLGQMSPSHHSVTQPKSDGSLKSNAETAGVFGQPSCVIQDSESGSQTLKQISLDTNSNTEKKKTMIEGSNSRRSFSSQTCVNIAEPTTSALDSPAEIPSSRENPSTGSSNGEREPSAPAAAGFNDTNAITSV